MYTILPYQYRDASNHRRSSEIVLRGQLAPADLDVIRAKLDSSENFIPADLDLGIDELQVEAEGFPSEDDHVWHELLLDDIEMQIDKPEGPRPIEVNAFVASFAAVTEWDVLKATERLGLDA